MVLPKYQKAEPKKRGRPANITANDAPRAASSEPPRKQRAKASAAPAQLDATKVAAARLATIAESLREAQCVPVEVREMLCSTLPGCLSITGEFHSYQEKTLWMLNQTLKDIQDEKTRRFQGVAGVLCRVKEEFQCLEKEQKKLEAAANKSSAEATDREIALSQSVAALNPCKLAVEKAQMALQSGDAVIGAAAMELEQLRLARAQMDSSSEEATIARLQKLCSGWLLGPEKLENLTLLEGELCQRLAVLSGIVSKTAVARVDIVDQLEDAQASLEATKEEQQACAVAHARIQTEQHERNAILKANTQALKQRKTVVGQTVRAFHTAQKQLAQFQKAPRAFKDIVAEIERRHGVHLFEEKAEARDTEAPSDALAELSKTENMSPLDASRLFATYPCSGTPVIDRQQRQAILRRRSAVLPRYCFSRLSLIARRSSIMAAKRAACASDSDADNAMESVQADKTQTAQETQVLEGALDIPTPNRRSSGAASH